MEPLIILAGPTAVGKTKLSIALAKAIRGGIISADSMQIYRYMDIGTAKIRPEEMEGIPHYLIDELNPDEDFHVAAFQKRAKEAIREIEADGRIPIVAGGTGFYIQALVRDIDFTEAETDGDYRRSLLRLADEKGAGFLHQMLEQLDPESARAIHPNNRKKVIRALEFYRQTGVPISRHNREQAQKKSPYRFCYFVVNEPRETLYRRIDSRVDQMIRDGLVEEVSKLKKMGYNKTMVSMQGLGYKEILDYLDGTVSLPEAVAAIKQNTRHFAKRQITWFKREPDAIWLNREDYAGEQDMLAAMLAVLREKEIWKGKGNDV